MGRGRLAARRLRPKVKLSQEFNFPQFAPIGEEEARVPYVRVRPRPSVQGVYALLGYPIILTTVFHVLRVCLAK